MKLVPTIHVIGTVSLEMLLPANIIIVLHLSGIYVECAECWSRVLIAMGRKHCEAPVVHTLKLSDLSGYLVEFNINIFLLVRLLLNALKENM